MEEETKKVSKSRPYITVYTTPEVKKQYRETAIRRGFITISAWIRDLLHKDMGKP